MVRTRKASTNSTNSTNRKSKATVKESSVADTSQIKEATVSAEETQTIDPTVMMATIKPAPVVARSKADASPLKAIVQPIPEEEEKAEVAIPIESQVTKEVKGEKGSERILVCTHMAHGIRFTDVPNGHGGTKVVSFPGVNSALKGKANAGILVNKGEALAFWVNKKDWEWILANHGKERVFTGWKGNPPLLIAMKGGEEEFKARKNEIIKDMVSGYEPSDPNVKRNSLNQLGNVEKE